LRVNSAFLVEAEGIPSIEDPSRSAFLQRIKQNDALQKQQKTYQNDCEELHFGIQSTKNKIPES
jgi:hypothetical protein